MHVWNIHMFDNYFVNELEISGYYFLKYTKVDVIRIRMICESNKNNNNVVWRAKSEKVADEYKKENKHKIL